VSVERVAILGCAGAGKTRAALLVAERTGLPVVHLDVLFWRAGWVAVEETEAQAALVAAADAPRWIIEGSFVRDGSDRRFVRADTVVFLDVGRWRCLGRVLRRLVRDRGRRRADLPAGCEETFSADLLRWVWRYPRVDRPAVLELLTTLEQRGIRVHRLRTGKDVNAFLSALPGRAGAADMSGGP
jgi:adenylate kinase family enzyme